MPDDSILSHARDWLDFGWVLVVFSLVPLGFWKLGELVNTALLLVFP